MGPNMEPDPDPAFGLNTDLDLAFEVNTDPAPDPGAFMANI